MGKALVAKLGLSGPGLIGYSAQGDIYLDSKLSPRDRQRLLSAAVAAYKADPQVEAVFTADQIARVPVPTGDPANWSLIQRERASFYAPRSGDFVVFLKKDITPISDTTRTVATHGSPYDYDRRVPILFWGPGIASQTIERSAETTDIAPTLAAYLGKCLDAPRDVDGHRLAEVAPLICPAR
jgi:hypothetical protein